jgi:hypothetical protein
LFQVAHKRRLRAEDQAKLVKEILISGSRRPSTQDLNADKSEKDISGSGSTIQNDENGKFFKCFQFTLPKRQKRHHPSSSRFYVQLQNCPMLSYNMLAVLIALK